MREREAMRGRDYEGERLCGRAAMRESSYEREGGYEEEQL